MNSYDYQKYFYQSIVVGLSGIAYNVFYDGKSATSSYVLNDAFVLVLSSVGSNIIYDIVSNIMPIINDNSVIGMIGRPLMTGIVYMYLYDMMIKGKYQYDRNSMTNFYAASLLSLLESYIESPLYSLFGVSLKY